MKDPITLGAVLSGATLFTLSVWKTRRLRWLALCIGIAALVWALGGEASAITLATGDGLSLPNCPLVAR